MKKYTYKLIPILTTLIFITAVGCTLPDEFAEHGPDTSVSGETPPDTASSDGGDAAGKDDDGPQKPVPGKTNSDKKDNDKTDDPGTGDKKPQGNPASDGSVSVFPDPVVVYSPASGFYEDGLSVTLSLPEGTDGTIYYSILTPKGGEFEEYVNGTEIRLDAGSQTDPAIYTISTFVKYGEDDYSYRDSATYFVGPNVFERFSTYVLSVSGNPIELTRSNGIFYGMNAKTLKGKESERVVSVELFASDGTPLISQRAGVRPFGGFSRALAVKSMKFYAREEYNSLKTFKTDIFGTKKQDGSDKTVKSYKRFVARNGGNDFGNAYIRDELAQIMAREAGYPDTEAILPVTVYLNGSYHGLLWLHENYSNKYFKEKYGDDAPGEFVVIEGSETEKTSDGQEAADFNAMHNYLAGLDMTNDDNYADACEFMDVYNYLDYYALNMYVANLDWPTANEKCYRYYAAEGEEYGEGVFDGRWRFLPHDMDMSMGLSEKSGAGFDAFDYVMAPDSPFYSPLFANLVKRPELKKYFRSKIIELSDTVFDPETALKILDDADAMRATEYPYYRAYIDSRTDDPEFVCPFPASQYDSSMEELRKFLSERKDQMLYRLDYYFPDY